MGCCVPTDRYLVMEIRFYPNIFLPLYVQLCPALTLFMLQLMFYLECRKCPFYHGDFGSHSSFLTTVDKTIASEDISVSLNFGSRTMYVLNPNMPLCSCCIGCLILIQLTGNTTLLLALFIRTITRHWTGPRIMHRS